VPAQDPYYPPVPVYPDSRSHHHGTEAPPPPLPQATIPEREKVAPPK
jgi:hypothetical protein